jgi:hypothetical protein
MPCGTRGEHTKRHGAARRKRHTRAGARGRSLAACVFPFACARAAPLRPDAARLPRYLPALFSVRQYAFGSDELDPVAQRGKGTHTQKHACTRTRTRRTRARTNAHMHAHAHAPECPSLNVPLDSDGFGALGASILDSLDTLYMMGLKPEFNRARAWVADKLTFAAPRAFERNEPTSEVHYSLFETTIRAVGGLLGAAAVSGDAMFVHKAAEVAERLLPAFDTGTGARGASRVDVPRGWMWREECGSCADARARVFVSLIFSAPPARRRAAGVGAAGARPRPRCAGAPLPPSFPPHCAHHPPPPRVPPPLIPPLNAGCHSV